MDEKFSSELGNVGQKSYVRGRSQIAPYHAERKPTGHRLTAFEAEKAYGPDLLREADEFGSAPLSSKTSWASSALADRRLQLGVTVDQAEKGMGNLPVSQAEDRNVNVPIQELERIAFREGLDERLLAYTPSAGGDVGLGVRLRSLLSEEKHGLSLQSVFAFSEAASIVRSQTRLAEWLGKQRVWQKFDRSSDYGDAVSPAFKIGYALAEKARSTLGLGYEPIVSLRRLVDQTLGIPVIQRPLPDAVAGATVANGDDRGIILNTNGANRHVWVRRFTLAHELGHLLFDPTESMKSVRVDSYEETETDPEETNRFRDFVEQRANAFAIAFLAPPDAIRKEVRPPFNDVSLAQVMQTYGISHTAARYHLWNSHWRGYDVIGRNSAVEPEDTWRVAEDFTLDYFPIKDVPASRRGRFAGLVAEAFEKGLISSDTAAIYLDCSSEEFENGAAAILDLYQDL